MIIFNPMHCGPIFSLEPLPARFLFIELTALGEGRFCPPGPSPLRDGVEPEASIPSFLYSFCERSELSCRFVKKIIKYFLSIADIYNVAVPFVNRAFFQIQMLFGRRLYRKAKWIFFFHNQILENLGIRPLDHWGSGVWVVAFKTQRAWPWLS